MRIPGKIIVNSWLVTSLIFYAKHESNCGFLYQDEGLMPTIKYAGTTPLGGNYAKQDSCL